MMNLLYILVVIWSAFNSSDAWYYTEPTLSTVEPSQTAQPDGTSAQVQQTQTPTPSWWRSYYQRTTQTPWWSLYYQTTTQPSSWWTPYYQMTTEPPSWWRSYYQMTTQTPSWRPYYQMTTEPPSWRRPYYQMTTEPPTWRRSYYQMTTPTPSWRRPYYQMTTQPPSRRRPYYQRPNAPVPSISVFRETQDSEHVMVTCSFDRRFTESSFQLSVEGEHNYTLKNPLCYSNEKCVFDVKVSSPVSFTCVHEINSVVNQHSETYTGYHEEGVSSFYIGFSSFIAVGLVIMTVAVIVTTIRSKDPIDPTSTVTGNDYMDA